MDPFHHYIITDNFDPISNTISIKQNINYYLQGSCNVFSSFFLFLVMVKVNCYLIEQMLIPVIYIFFINKCSFVKGHHLLGSITS